jgi:hypothetical protein
MVVFFQAPAISDPRLGPLRPTDSRASPPARLLRRVLSAQSSEPCGPSHFPCSLSECLSLTEAMSHRFRASLDGEKKQPLSNTYQLTAAAAFFSDERDDASTLSSSPPEPLSLTAGLPPPLAARWFHGADDGARRLRRSPGSAAPQPSPPAGRPPSAARPLVNASSPSIVPCLGRPILSSTGNRRGSRLRLPMDGGGWVASVRLVQGHHIYLSQDQPRWQAHTRLLSVIRTPRAAPTGFLTTRAPCILRPSFPPSPLPLPRSSAGSRATVR